MSDAGNRPFQFERGDDVFFRFGPFLCQPATTQLQKHGVKIRAGQTLTRDDLRRGVWPSGYFPPNGKWLAYSSELSGVEEIFLQPFPEGGKPVCLTKNGGAALIELFQGDYPAPAMSGRFALLAPDGKRFLLVRDDPAAKKHQVTVALNWFSDFLRFWGRAATEAS